MTFRISTGNVRVTDDQKRRVLEVLKREILSEGYNVHEFEKVWADYLQTKHCILVNSGTSALIVSLMALKQKLGVPRLKVLTTPLTYVATANSVLMTDNDLEFIDIEEDTWGINPDILEARLKDGCDSSYVVLAVHLMGMPCQIEKIKSICDKYKISLIEDTCQAYGSKVNGRMLGSFGDLSVCSYFVAHTLQVGEMGSINTNDPWLATLCNKIKSNGRTVGDKNEYFYKNDIGVSDLDFHPRYFHDVVGGNFRTQEFSAALALSQFYDIKDNLLTRYLNVKHLNSTLEQFENIVKLPEANPDYAHFGYHLLIKDDSINRKSLRMLIEDRGVETRPLFGCLPKDMPSLKRFSHGSWPVAEKIGRRAFYVGCHQYLSMNDLFYLSEVLKDVLGRSSKQSI